MNCDRCKPSVEVLEKFYEQTSPEFRRAKIFKELDRINAKCPFELTCLPLKRIKKEIKDAK